MKIVGWNRRTCRKRKKVLQNVQFIDRIVMYFEMAVLVKWLTRRIVAPVCKGSIPLFRPRMEKSRIDLLIEIDSYESIFFVVRKELVIFGN